MKALLDYFHLNDNTLEFRQQPNNIETPCATWCQRQRKVVVNSFYFVILEDLIHRTIWYTSHKERATTWSYVRISCANMKCGFTEVMFKLEYNSSREEINAVGRISTLFRRFLYLEWVGGWAEVQSNLMHRHGDNQMWRHVTSRQSRKYRTNDEDLCKWVLVPRL